MIRLAGDLHKSGDMVRRRWTRLKRAARCDFPSMATVDPTVPMTRITVPTRIDHDELREFAVKALCVAKLEEAVSVLETLVDLVEEDRPDNIGCGSRIPWMSR